MLKKIAQETFLFVSKICSVTYPDYLQVIFSILIFIQSGSFLEMNRFPLDSFSFLVLPKGEDNKAFQKPKILGHQVVFYD